MKAAEYSRIVAHDMREAVLQEKVRVLAKTLGLRYYHTHTSKFSPTGFPDVVLVVPPLCMYRELKRQTEKPTPEQRAWLDDLAACGYDVDVWRPSDLLDGRIEAEMRALAQGRGAA